MDGTSIHHDVVGFVRALRNANIRVGVDQTETFARALSWIDPLSRRHVYLAARSSLVCRREDFPIFDAIFEAFWCGTIRERESKGQKAPLAPRHDPSTFHRTALVSFMAEKAKQVSPDIDVPEEAKAASDVEVLQNKDFSDLTDEEHASLAFALRHLRFDPARRQTRRFISSRRGKDLDTRRTLRSASRHGGTAIELFRRRRKVKRRPLVVLADISGSMELYTRVLLQFLHAFTHAHDQTETFVFGTRLTRITSQLKLRDVDYALDHAAKEIVDFAGGTRIGESLRAFNRVYGPRVLRRGAVVLLVSDGWERGDAHVLDEELARLKGRCHRLIWLNPLLGRARYEPLAEGITTALRHVDDFLPIDNLQSMKSLVGHLARLPERKARCMMMVKRSVRYEAAR
jgi:uncharacterized protein with von Willebrand factor type A (vWA) domain